MVLNWIQSLCYGLVAGLTDVLPVSAQAHQTLLLKLYGVRNGMELVDLFVHLGILASLYCSCRSWLFRMNRARALARVPRRRRKRPLDERSLMDFRLLRTICVPVILGLLIYGEAFALNGKLMVVAGLLLVNGVILYVPQFLPSSNRDSRTLSRVEGILTGLGGAMGVLPGMSSIGGAISMASICGMERVYALNMALLMNMVMTIGLLVWDVMGLTGISLTAVYLLRCLATGIAAFAANMLGIHVMRRVAAEFSNTVFGLYCIGLALFIFILNLLA